MCFLSPPRRVTDCFALYKRAGEGARADFVRRVGCRMRWLGMGMSSIGALGGAAADLYTLYTWREKEK